MMTRIALQGIGPFALALTTVTYIMERRMKRSEQPEEAIQLLLESLADRSEARAVALVNGKKRVLAAAGQPWDIADLREVAEPVALGEECRAIEKLDNATDVFSRPVTVGASTVYLAAMGTRMRRFGEAAIAVARIVQQRVPA
jgi:hypothetical protein